MPVLDARGLRKAIGPLQLLDGVDLTIARGQRVGLVGANGCGKSTLGRILAGDEPPDEGTLALRRGATVGYLAQAPELDPESTARSVVRAGLQRWSEAHAAHQQASRALEKLRSAPGRDRAGVERLLRQQTEAAAALERLGGWDVEHRVERLLEQLGIHERATARIETLSGGEQRRVALARVLIMEPDLAVLDEPTNHVDLDTIAWLEQYLIQTFRGALLLITHDRYLLDRVAQRTVELDSGELYSYPGGYTAYLEAKSERLALQARVEKNRARYLREELAWLRRQPKARTGKQKARKKRIEAALDTGAPPVEQTVALRAASTRTGKSILDLRDLAIAFGDRVLVDGLTLTLRKGQRIGIIGRSGCGKTTLLRTLVGDRPPDAGEVAVGKNTRVGYLSQLRSKLDPALSIRENVAGDREHLAVGAEEVDIFSYLGRFLFSGAALDQPVGSLSGGERTRVALALLLAQPANLLVLDEPTNDLDVPTIGALEAMLLEFSGTALIASHDRWFLDRVATDILAFNSDGQVVHSVGNYRDYAARAATAARAEASERPKRTSPAERARKPGPRGLTYAERLELTGLEEQIERVEQTVRDLEARLADPTLYTASDAHHRAAQLAEELAAARAQAETLTARWETLELKREAAGQ